jgi:signal transduction histidine kinase/CheY-like chemotaxis protein
MVNVVIILLSVLFQVLAAGAALRTLRITERRMAYILITLALALMALRRAYLLGEQLVKGTLPPWIMPSEIAALLISMLMLAGIILARRELLILRARRMTADSSSARARLEVDRLAAVMEAAPLPIWIAEDPECRVIHGNPAADDLLRMPRRSNHSQSTPGGRGPGHFRFQRDGRDLPPDDLPMQQAMRQGETIRDAPMDLLFEDGTLLHLLGNATPLRDAGGQVIGGVASFVDLTDIRRMETRLRHTDKFESLSLMAGGIAHDFNNLFQAIGGNLELARTRLPDGHPALTYLDRLQGSLDRATGLSREILHCSGGEFRRPESLDLSEVVSAVAAGHPGAVEINLAADLPPIVADARLVARVAEGILANALEAGPPGSPVQVRTFAHRMEPMDLTVGFWPEAPPMGPCVVLEIQDQGQGIPAATVPRIFDPFFSTRTVGRGLGLASALGIVRSHGGGIQVESAPGRGSRFRVYFPSREPSQAGTCLPEPSPGNRRVLLADDEPTLRETLAEMLHDWFGYDVDEATDGEDALAQFQRQPEVYDLVLLDATMPRLGGVEAFRAMRAIRPGLAGILASGYAEENARQQAQAHGFADFLKKPFTGAELREVLERTARKP